MLTHDALHSQVVQRTAEAFACSAEVSFLEDVHPIYPPVVNNPQAYNFAMDVGEQCAPLEAAVQMNVSISCSAAAGFLSPAGPSGRGRDM